MSREQIRRLVEDHVGDRGMVDIGVEGVGLFRVGESVRCSPAVYEPTLVAVVSGAKEVIMDGTSYVYDRSRYLCCALSMPVEAGTPTASPDDPLVGVQIALDPRVMSELSREIDVAPGAVRERRSGALPPGWALARWDDEFTEALLRLVQLADRPADAAVLGEGRLREVYYALLKGEAGPAARRAFGMGNEIARVIERVSAHLDEPVTIDDMAAQVGMSRAVFHRRFKEATAMSPLQFVKAIRLNTAAMRMAGGMTVNEAAMEVGYASASQFSREFKRTYGQSPKQWSRTMQPLPAGVI
ncbi:AraC family transcriptional regulator [Agromyces sp. SYSU T0242]|uniref:AraC family transcriptional regulator n=1 Tax=Agromyces litoreus TaxID=3158561 RepID=UPI00339A2334